jgi:hypothetical protein
MYFVTDDLLAVTVLSKKMGITCINACNYGKKQLTDKWHELCSRELTTSVGYNNSKKEGGE